MPLGELRRRRYERIHHAIPRVCRDIALDARPRGMAPNAKGQLVASIDWICSGPGSFYHTGSAWGQEQPSGIHVKYRALMFPNAARSVIRSVAV